MGIWQVFLGGFRKVGQPFVEQRLVVGVQAQHPAIIVLLEVADYALEKIFVHFGKFADIVIFVHGAKRADVIAPIHRFYFNNTGEIALLEFI
jgi:hypothetical protein